MGTKGGLSIICGASVNYLQNHYCDFCLCTGLVELGFILNNLQNHYCDLCSPVQMVAQDHLQLFARSLL